jgi:ADP-ribose pyrophosphatase YjhB (NUDIX family)
MREHTNAGDRWIPEADYRFICARVPIMCVDLLPVLADTGRFGLVERDTYDGGRGLNLIGGGVLLDEPLTESLDRHLRATLGEATDLRPDTLALVGIYQYFKVARPGRLHDPRKNSVSITYAGVLDGEPKPSGEAHAFHTFELDHPPGLTEFGFGQGTVVYDALATVRAKRMPSW